MINTQPTPCSEAKFVSAQMNSQSLGWKQAGNGESFRIQDKDSLAYFARTGKHYWHFSSPDTLSHGNSMFRVQEVMLETA